MSDHFAQHEARSARLKWLSGWVLVAGLMTAALWWWDDGLTRVPVARPPTPSAPSTSAAPVKLANEAVATTPIGARPMAATHQPSASSSKRQASHEPLTAAQSCKRLAATVGKPNEAQAQAQFREQAELGWNARQAVIERWRTGSDPLRQAAALALVAANDAPPGLCGAADCSDANQRRMAAAVQAQAQLASLALAQPTPKLQAWARYACLSTYDGIPKPASCLALAATPWWQVAPTDIAPWLQAAVDAHVQGDTGGQENALMHAAQVSDWHNPVRDLLPLLASDLPAQLTGISRETALASIHLSLAWDHNIFGLRFSCPAHQDANRQQWCRPLAEKALRNVSQLMTLEHAIRLAVNSGVDVTTVALAQQELQVLGNARRRQRPPGQTYETCMDRLAYSQRVREIGERAALREQLAGKR
jgi:hypothetical protein